MLLFNLLRQDENWSSKGNAAHTDSRRGESYKTGAFRRVAEEQRAEGFQVYSKLWGFLVSCTPGLLKWDTQIYRARSIKCCMATAVLTQTAASQHLKSVTPSAVKSGLQASSAFGEDEILAWSQD